MNSNFILLAHFRYYNIITDRNDYQMARKILNTQTKELHKLYSSIGDDELLRQAIKLEGEARHVDEVNFCISSRKVAKTESYKLYAKEEAVGG